MCHRFIEPRNIGQHNHIIQQSDLNFLVFHRKRWQVGDGSHPSKFSFAIEVFHQKRRIESGISVDGLILNRDFIEYRTIRRIRQLEIHIIVIDVAPDPDNIDMPLVRSVGCERRIDFGRMNPSVFPHGNGRKVLGVDSQTHAY